MPISAVWNTGNPLAADMPRKILPEFAGIISDRVQLASFSDYETDIKFDGIWTCASFLHIEPDELGAMIKKFTGFLVRGGIFFLSFKYGTEDYVKDGRYFNCQTAESVREILKSSDNIEILEIFITSDVREGRSDEKWVNVIIRKSTC